MSFLCRANVAGVLALLVASSVSGQDAAAPAVRHALIVCGLPGDAAHRTLFGETIEKLYAGLTNHHGFAPERVAVLWSDAKPDAAGPALAGSREMATREALAEVAAALARDVQAVDSLWVFVLGHAHYDGKNSWLNLPGPD